MKKSHEMVEKALVDELLKGEVKPGTPLQSERDLAARFSVSRATVREALLRLQKSGWISVQQRHSTMVNDFWSRGNLDLLNSISKNKDPFPPDLATNLLELRVQVAPDYARKAVENDAEKLTEQLSRFTKLKNSISGVVKFDWDLHLSMAVMSGNKIYPMIMNSFAALYLKIKEQLFATPEHRVQARAFYEELLEAAVAKNPDQAEEVTRAAMQLRLEEYKKQAQEPPVKKRSLKERLIRR